MLMYAYLLLSIFQMPFTIPTAKRNSQKRGARRCPGCLPETEVSVVTLLRLIKVLTARKGSEVRLQTVMPLWFCIELKHWIPRCHLLANWQKLLHRED